jgi:hypothetical protein
LARSGERARQRGLQPYPAGEAPANTGTTDWPIWSVAATKLQLDDGVPNGGCVCLPLLSVYHAPRPAGERPSSQHLVAADADGTRLGFAHAWTETSVFTCETVGFLSTLTVAQSAVGQGVGRPLTWQPSLGSATKASR